MAKLNDQWTVGPHGPVDQLDEGLVTVAGDIAMPLGNFPRRMTVVALSGKRSAVFSAIPLRDPEMREIEALGDPTFLIVPSAGHRLDVAAWKKRYPHAKVLCPPGARKAVSEAVEVDATDNVLDDPDVRFETVPGVGEQEAALLVRRGDGTSLVLNDILANVRHPHGIGAHVMARLFGFGVGGPQMPWIVRRKVLKDGKALAAGLRAWAQEPDLKRIVVSHGEVIDEGPRAVLEKAAAEAEAAA